MKEMMSSRSGSSAGGGAWPSPGLLVAAFLPIAFPTAAGHLAADWATPSGGEGDGEEGDGALSPRLGHEEEDGVGDGHAPEGGGATFAADKADAADEKDDVDEVDEVDGLLE